MSKKIHSYGNDDLTITWDGEKCFHSEVCIKNLSSVFNLENKPWINVDGASKEEIVDLIKQCPSGALGFQLNDEHPEREKESSGIKIRISRNGPILVTGNFELEKSDGSLTQITKNMVFCRC